MPPPPPVVGLLVFDPPANSATAVGRAFFPGYFTAACTIRITAPGWPPQEFTLIENCAVVGGPLRIEVDGADVVNTPKWDAYDSEKPWYLQYFGNQPLQPHPGPLDQRAQYAKVRVALAQPPEVRFQWEKEGPVVWRSPPESQLETANNVEIAATNGSGKGEIVVRVKYTIEFEGQLYGPFDDDTDETPPPNEPSPRETYRRFTAHRPNDTKGLAKLHIGHSSSPPYHWEDAYLMVLFDHLGDAMPAVWVQEVFHKPNGQGYNQFELPPGFSTNQQGQPWVTKCKQEYFKWGEETMEEWGSFIDFLSVNGFMIYHPYELNPNNPQWNLHHAYYAGNRDVSWPRPLVGGGIRVGYWSIRIWSDWSEHVKQ